MPSPLPSSFASAAAGNTHDGPSGRGPGSGEWSRSRTNGATQTFRRPSLATNLSHHRDSSMPQQQQQQQQQQSSGPQSNNTSAYIPPHLNSNFRNGSTSDTRYSKEQLMNLYKAQREAGSLNKNLSELFLGGWNPTESRNGVAASWGRREEGKDSSTGPDVCWEPNGKILPLGISEMSEEEKELFASSVNSPLKGPTSNKEGTPGSSGNRKQSISQNGPYNASPHSTRPGPRRRETGETNPIANPLSPTGGGRFFRDEPSTSTPPTALLRRKTDLKETPTSETKPGSKPKEEARDATGETNSPFDSLKRRTTGGPSGPLSAGFPGPESPWSAGSPSATFGSMGAFGSFSLGPGSSNAESAEKEKRPGFGSMRGESRFKGLLSKASSEEIGAQEKPSSIGLQRLAEDENPEGRSQWEVNRQSRQSRSVTNPYEDDPSLGGSAGLGGSLETEPTIQTQGDLGFSAFGEAARNIGTGRSSSHQQTPQSRQLSQEPMSPTNTNPYQSPDADNIHGDDGNHGADDQHLGFSALGSLRQDSSADAFGSFRGKTANSLMDDRSQTSSTGPNRMFPGFGGLSALPNVGGPSPWSANPVGSSNTPTKERSGFPNAFGDSMFGSMAEMQSPSLVPGGTGGGGFFGSSSNAGGFGRSSKMGSLFPQAMQDQMKNRPGSAGDGFGGLRSGGEQPMSSTSPGFFGEGGAFDPSGRMPRGFEEGNPPDNQYGFAQSSFTQTPSAPGSGALSKVGPAEGQQGQNLSQSSGSSNSNQLPAAQQRQMVMPDRMRWIYRDPQGNTQGPWSGLEMHDWFKAGFFTAELQVKKLEDPDYEPLAQLVRRIGNSREPFLVPQIGVPHGPAAPTPGNTWAGSSGPMSGGVPQGGGTQPPFASSFPSFGTTLTAEQQNALERRKQEEQYLMARQKEHLAQQQVLMKQMAMQGAPHSMHHNLQHHGSAHSLHSQPSFGSITSPSGYQPSPVQGPIQPPPPMGGFPEGRFRQPTQSNVGVPGQGNDGDGLPPFYERMNANRGGQLPLAGGPFTGRPQEGPSQQAIGTMMQDRARLQAEQQQMNLSGEPLPEFQNNDRLQQFQNLRIEDDALGHQQAPGPSAGPIGGHARPRQDEQTKKLFPYDQTAATDNKAIQESPEPEMLSLSEQAQHVAAAQQQPPSVWAQRMEQPIVPPPQSASPLPAPAAQRRQNVADTLVAEPRSRTQTPVETPSASIAPWADKTIELPKGPSLKEIQEAEAKKAAKQEELAAAARRAQAQAEMERQQATALPAPAPGLPSSSTWANATGPATPTASGSVWAKTPVTKAAVATPASTAKKTLAQIQKEEEARKLKAASAAAAVQAGNNGNANLVAGKRYAELASKAAPATPQAAAPSGAWTTVGSGGKVKAPATVVAAPGTAQRTPSGSVPVQAKGRPTPTRAPGSSVASQPASQSKATDELIKWAKGQLGKGLASGINVDEFVQSLLILPNETEIISDSVYATSQTLDGRRFAEEFVRKRKLADKGVIEGGSNTNGPAIDDSKNGATGGWSEVAKKGPEKKDESASNSAFKVVAGKKKGRR